MYYFWAVIRLRTLCASVADEIPCVDDLALNAPEGASVAKIICSSTIQKCRLSGIIVESDIDHYIVRPLVSLNTNDLFPYLYILKSPLPKEEHEKTTLN
jgi:hypothetical protein